MSYMTEPSQDSGSEGNNAGQEHPSNIMSNTLEVFESSPALTDSASTSSKDFQINTQGSDTIIKEDQRQLIKSTTSPKGTTYATDQDKSDNQQLINEPSDQTTLTDIHRCDLNRCDDVEGIIGISTHGPSCHGPRTLLEVIKGGLKSKLKVTQAKE